jgi:amino acid permease
MALPAFELSVSYLLAVIAVTMTSLIMMIFGGWMRERMQKGGLRFRFAKKTRFRRKLTGFLLFIVAIFLLGWLSERLQIAIHDYLSRSAGTTISGIAVALLVTWFMYDWFVYRKNRVDDD